VIGFENQLTDGQKACLRRVAQGKTSKEIAIELRLSPATVDTYLKLATARLKAQNRRDAARRFIDLEHSQKFGSQSEAVATPPNPPQHFLVTEPSTSSNIDGNPARWRQILPPPLGGVINNTTTGQRIAATFKIAFWCVILFLAIVLFIRQALSVLS
jgi:DNA-binding CsgD family transcriptional regulator